MPAWREASHIARKRVVVCAGWPTWSRIKINKSIGIEYAMGPRISPAAIFLENTKSTNTTKRVHLGLLSNCIPNVLVEVHGLLFPTLLVVMNGLLSMKFGLLLMVGSPPGLCRFVSAMM